MKKRFFTFLMAVWALLSISQTVKAGDVTVYFQCPDGQDGWKTPVCAYAYNSNDDRVSDWFHAPAGSEYYTSTGVKLWKCTFDSKYKYVIFKEPADGQNKVKQYPDGQGFEVKDNDVYIYNQKGPTGTPLSEFVKKSAFTYTLTGSYNTSSGTDLNNESTSFVFDGDGKYTYTFTAAQTGRYCFRINTSYTSGAALCPETNASGLTSTPTEVAYNDKEGYSNYYWTYDVTVGKKYTFTLTEQYNSTGSSYTRKLSVVPEEAVVTKVIKLLNGSSELTGSNGSYTLDLSGETSSDANITLTINGAKYGLATAQTISAAGTTNVDFGLNEPAALTLTKGFIYSLSVTEAGKMTVVAAEKVNPVITADAGFYLVGDFMSQYNDKTVNPGGDDPGKINYERLYFKFEQQNDGSYKIDIPACLTAKMQILGVSVDGVSRVYGPVGIKKLHGPSATENASPVTNGVVGGVDGTDKLEVVNGFNDIDNYWNLENRNNDVANADGLKDDDGSYEVSFKYDPKTQSPTTWTIKHDGCKRVAYLLSTAKGATAQPLYNIRKSVGADYDDNLKAAIHFDGSNSYYVLGTVVRNMSTEAIKTQALKAKDGIHYMGNGYGTHNKLFFLGSEPQANVQSSNKLYGNQPAVVLPKIKGTKIIEVNPTRGDDRDAMKDNSYGLQADFQIPGTLNEVDYPDAISMVGPAIPSTTTTVDGTTKWLWDAIAGDMTYDESDRCYKLVLNTSAESFKKTFRFVGDHDIAMNWYEDTTPANDKYPTKAEGTSDATVEDPNYVDYTSVCTEKTIDHNKDIIWNRGAGLWTVRFYIDVDNANKRTFRYTITGASKIYIPVTAHMGKLLRTYTSAVDVVPVDANVLIYAAQSYTKKNENNTGSGDETGTVKLYRLKYIPANQGVVLYSPNSPLGNGTPTKLEVVPAYSATVKRYSSDVFDYVADWAKPETKKEQIWVNQVKHENDGEKWNNYLMPVLADTKVTQFYYDENGKWTGRIFSFTRYSKTDTGRANGVIEDNTTDSDSKKHDYFSFFRAAGTVKASYSYLMLPLTVMKGNGQILDQNKDNDTKAFAKSMVWFEGIDAPMDNETTGISELNNHVSNTDAAYYTLQGVKVAKPVKGIYIHQGKKVIVK